MKCLAVASAIVLVGCGSTSSSAPPVEGDGSVDASALDSTVDSATPTDSSAAEDAPSEAAPDDAAGDSSTIVDSLVPDGPADVAPEANVDAETGSDAGCVPVVAPTIVQTGNAAIVLVGRIVTPDTIIDGGSVVVQGNTITCVGASCTTPPNATVVQTSGVIAPGMIDTHNHILFDIFDETDWSPDPAKTYINHNQWTTEARYSALVDAKQYLNHESGSPVDVGCELDKYGELKALVAGTTSVLGAANPDRACYQSLTRTIDTQYADLDGVDHVRVATLYPTSASGQTACDDFTPAGKTTAFVVHIAEGAPTTPVNAIVSEFDNLAGLTTPEGCLDGPHTVLVHGSALDSARLATAGSAKMSLTWSPRSNVFLYGHGTDFKETTDIPTALADGILVSLAPDWSIGGSQNMLDELRFADVVDDNAFGNVLAPKDLVAMGTKNPARALGLDASIGSIAVGMRADLVIYAGDSSAPYDTILAATPRDVELVMIDGVPLYGDAALLPIAHATPACETIDVCCASKFVCVAESSTANGLDETYATIASKLESAMEAYDALELTPYSFAPITPLVRCP